MANPQHIEWLMEGIAAWNARRDKEDFVPDFEGADFPVIFQNAGKHRHNESYNLLGVNLSNANLRHTRLTKAILRGANLRQADFHGTDLTSANLELSDIRGTSFRKSLLSRCNFERCKALSIVNSDRTIWTSFRQTTGLTQGQLNAMNGDSFTEIPQNLRRPWKWLDATDNEAASGAKAHAPSSHDLPLIRFTPPAEFNTKGVNLSIQYFPQSPEPRQATRTPIDDEKEATSRLALSRLVSTFCSALRKYKREDEVQSNRVRQAEQLLITAEALHRALRTNSGDFLPILMEDYVETLALGHALIND